MKRPETRTLSVTYTKAMYQVSVEYVQGYGEKSQKNYRWDGRMDRQRANLQSPLVKPVRGK